MKMKPAAHDFRLCPAREETVICSSLQHNILQIIFCDTPI